MQIMACCAAAAADPSGCLWKPESIRVFAGEGRPPLDIVEYLQDPQHPEAKRMRCRKRLEFPSDVYPPTEASKSLIENAIITAAAAVNIHLLRRRSEKTKSGGKGKCATTLVCHRAIAYRPQTKARKKANTTTSSRTNITVSTGAGSIPKNNVEHSNSKEEGSPYGDDNLIHLKQRQQQQCTTTNTKPRAKRAYYTIKPITADQTCHFSIRICLDPGQCWYLPSWGGNVYHNHPRELQREPHLVQPSVPRGLVPSAVHDSKQPQQQHSFQTNHGSSAQSQLLFRDRAQSQLDNVLGIIERANHDPELLQIWDTSMKTMLADMKTWMEARRK